MDLKDQTSRTSKKNFGLTQVEFEELCSKLEKGNESLIEIIYKSHFEVCRLFLVNKMNITPETAYDVTKDTLLKFRKNLLAGKLRYGNLSALYTIDARNSILRWKQKNRNNKQVEFEDQFYQIADDTNDEPYDNDLIEKLKNTLKNLGDECAELLNWHYYLELKFRTIAEKRILRGDLKFINEDSVKTKIAECRKKIKKLLI